MNDVATNEFHSTYRLDGTQFPANKKPGIEDLSLGGCFVNTSGAVDIGEIVSLEIKLPSGEWLPLRGEVVSYQQGIGFGILFSFLTDEEEQELRAIVS